MKVDTAHIKGGWNLGPVARGLAGPFVNGLARVLQDREGEAAFVLASWPRQHALLAALDGPHPATPETLRAAFDAGSPRDLVILGHGAAPAGLTSFFAKVGQERPPSLGGYRKLIRLLVEGGSGAKLLRHHPCPDFHMVYFLADLPGWARCVQAMNTDDARLGTMVALGEALQRTGQVSTEVLSRAISGRSCERHPVALLASAGVDIRLPEPPLPASNNLRPIRSAQRFLAIAALFRNCLELRLTEALTGAKAYYVWLEAEPLVVELKLVDGLWWRFSEANGYRNIASLEHTQAEAVVSDTLVALNHRRLDSLMEIL